MPSWKKVILSGSDAALNSLAVTTNITASSLTGSFTGSLRGTASYASQALSSSYALSASLAQTASFLNNTVYNREIHVSSGSGDDTNGNGTLLKPYKTVTKAFSVVGGSGEAIVIHPGTYAESATLTAQNVTVASVNTGGGITNITGTITIDAPGSSTRIIGVRISTLVHQNTGSLYLENLQIPTSFSKTSIGYTEIIDCDTQAASGLSFTSAATTVIQGGKQGVITVNNASAIVTLKDSFTAVTPTVTAGTFAAFNSIIYSLASGSNALTGTVSSVVNLVNCYVVNPSGTAERISVSGFLGYENTVFNKPLSTLGTSLNIKPYFQSAEILSLTATGSLFGTSSWANSASQATSASYALSSSYALSASYVNITGSGVIVNYNGSQIQLTGSATSTTPSLQEVTTVGNTTSGSIYIGDSSLDASARFQVDSTTQGILFPRMTNTQRTSIATPATGLIVYCTDAPEGLFIYKSTGWVQII